MTLQDRIECLQELVDHPGEYHIPPRTITALQWVIEDLKKEKDKVYNVREHCPADNSFEGMRIFLRSDEPPPEDEERDPMAGGLIFRS